MIHGWIEPRLRQAMEAHAGDPGDVTMRRLTNAEYDAMVRDLTGLDFSLARDFEPDGGGGEGFSNIGDVLFVSSRQCDHYLTAARRLANHASILPGTGVVFYTRPGTGQPRDATGAAGCRRPESVSDSRPHRRPGARLPSHRRRRRRHGGGRRSTR